MHTSANTPRIRFEGFSGNWEEQTFRDGFDLMPNNTLSRAELCNMAEGTRNIHYGDILVKFGEIIDASKDSLPSWGLQCTGLYWVAAPVVPVR